MTFSNLLILFSGLVISLLVFVGELLVFRRDANSQKNHTDKHKKSFINSNTASNHVPKVEINHIMKATTKLRLIREIAQDNRPQMYGA